MLWPLFLMALRHSHSNSGHVGHRSGFICCSDMPPLQKLSAVILNASPDHSSEICPLLTPHLSIFVSCSQVSTMTYFNNCEYLWATRSDFLFLSIKMSLLHCGWIVLRCMDLNSMVVMVARGLILEVSKHWNLRFAFVIYICKYYIYM